MSSPTLAALYSLLPQPPAWEHQMRANYSLAAIEAEYDALLTPEMAARLKASRTTQVQS